MANLYQPLTSVVVDAIACLETGKVARRNSDGTIKNFVRMKFVDKGTGPVIYGIAREQHVVGIHYAVHKTQQLPFCDQFRLSGDSAVEHG